MPRIVPRRLFRLKTGTHASGSTEAMVIEPTIHSKLPDAAVSLASTIEQLPLAEKTIKFAWQVATRAVGSAFEHIRARFDRA